MADEIDTENEDRSELAVLKMRATQMGIAYSPNIGIDTLKERIRAKLENDTAGEASGVDHDDDNDDTVTDEEGLYADAMALVRVRIQNLDPKKRDLPGEILAVGNNVVGMVKMFVPYGETTDDGWHLPRIMYEHLKGRKFLDIRTEKRNGKETQRAVWAREFALELLPQLTEDELRKLAIAQMAEGLVQEPDALSS